MQVRLALCRTDSECLDLRRTNALFSPERLARISRRPVQGQREAAAGQLLLRSLLEETLPGVAFPPRLVYNGQDKPILADYPELWFNISHSGGWAVCALCAAPVGADLQLRRPIPPGIVRKFALSERKLLEKLPESEQNSAACDLWSLKEAYSKCTGEGLRVPLNRAAFTLDPVRVSVPGYTALLLPGPEAGYSLAVCAETEQPLEVLVRELPF